MANTSKSFIGFTASLILYFSGINTLYAKIPDELLYQPPKNVQSTQLATLVGFQKLNALQLIKARIYLTYINDKATLNRSHDWNKVYEISPGLTDIRLVSDTPNYFTSGRLKFTAKASHHYQVKNNQADIKFNKEPLLFWVEDLDTGEVVTPKQELLGITVPSSVSFFPVIISK